MQQQVQMKGYASLQTKAVLAFETLVESGLFFFSLTSISISVRPGLSLQMDCRGIISNMLRLCFTFVFISHHSHRIIAAKSQRGSFVMSWNQPVRLFVVCFPTIHVTRGMYTCLTRFHQIKHHDVKSHVSNHIMWNWHVNEAEKKYENQLVQHAELCGPTVATTPNAFCRCFLYLWTKTTNKHHVPVQLNWKKHFCLKHNRFCTDTWRYWLFVN